MLRRKRELIDEILRGRFQSHGIIKRVTNKIMRMPEKEFVDFIDSETPLET